MLRIALLVVLVGTALGVAAPPEPTISGPIAQPFMIELKAVNLPPEAAVRWQVFVKNRDGDYVLGVGKVQTRQITAEKVFIFSGPIGEYLVLASYLKGQEYIDLTWVGKLTGGPDQPRPPPIDPPVPPIPPKPVEVKTFSCFLVYAAGTPLTPKQHGVFYGVELENSLNAAISNPTDAAKFGWRRIDWKANPTTLPASLSGVWSVAQPRVTVVPSMVFQVNETITLEPLPPTGAEAAALVTKYRSGK